MSGLVWDGHDCRGGLFQTVTVAFGDPDEFVGVFAANGGPVAAELFNADPTVTTFGCVNHSLTAIPEPSSFAIIALSAGGLGLVRRRRK